MKFALLRIKAGSGKKRLQTVVLLVGSLVLAYALISCSEPPKPENTNSRWSREIAPASDSSPGNANVAAPSNNPEAPVSAPDSDNAPQDRDYSNFQHTNATHSRLPCLLCHRRDTNAARISFPGKSGHLPCAGCHALQFSDNTSPICTICHTGNGIGLKRFPGLKDFTARFDHGRHQGVNCAVCHKSASRGVAFSIPSGAAAHETCFRCHTSTTPSKLSSCDTCHVPGRPSWTSEWARAYKISFSHSKHVSGANLSCVKCHAIKAGASRGQQVSKPLVAMHFAPANSLSCGGCHNGTKAFGANDFSNCKRCHQGKTFKF